MNIFYNIMRTEHNTEQMNALLCDENESGEIGRMDNSWLIRIKYLYIKHSNPQYK